MTGADESLSSGYGTALGKKFPYARIDQKVIALNSSFKFVQTIFLPGSLFV
jgi:hypothetical protein